MNYGIQQRQRLRLYRPLFCCETSQEVGKWYNELILDPADVLCRREQSAIPPIVCSQAGGIGEVEITQQVSARFQLAVPSAVCAVSEKKSDKRAEDRKVRRL